MSPERRWTVRVWALHLVLTELLGEEYPEWPTLPNWERIDELRAVADAMAAELFPPGSDEDGGRWRAALAAFSGADPGLTD